MTDILLKNYIHSVDINETLRGDLEFSDADKIRMYSDERRGVRLKPFRYSKPAKKVEFTPFNVASPVTVRLPGWSPQAVKGWGGFEEVSSKPAFTAIDWRVSNDTNDYWAEPTYPSDLLMLAQFNDIITPSFALDHYRDGSAPVITQYGSASIVAPGVSGFGDGALRVAGGGANGVLYTGAQLVAAKNTCTVRFRVRPNYSGTPALEQVYFYSLELATFKNAIALGHSTGGLISVLIGDESGSPIFFTPGPVWSPVAGTWYEWELTFDTTPGTGFGTVLRIDGVEVFADASLGSRTAGTVDVFGFGTEGTAESDCIFDEVHVYDTVQHVADYTPATVEFEPDRSWAIVSLDTDWNTETEISANISTFPHTQKYIQFIARLRTTDRWETPVLLGTRLLMTASFDWFEDLILRSLVPRMEEDFTFLMDWSGVLESETDRFNIKTDHPFKPEEDLNVIGIEAVYNDDTDPGYETDLLSSFDVNTGLAILTGTIPINTRLFYRLNVSPEVAVNFTNTDYDEVGKTPTIIIDRVDIEGRQVEATIEMSMKDRSRGVKLTAPLWVEHMRFQCTLITGKLVNAFRLMTQAYAFVIRGSKEQVGHKVGPILKTNALDLEHTLKITPISRYNPNPNFSDLKEAFFEVTICNFYAWLRDMETKYLVVDFNTSITDMRDTGTGNPEDDNIQPLPGGAFPFIDRTPEVEEV